MDCAWNAFQFFSALSAMLTFVFFSFTVSFNTNPGMLTHAPEEAIEIIQDLCVFSGVVVTERVDYTNNAEFHGECHQII